MLRREMEQEVLQVARQSGVGVVAFSALAQGLLTQKYLNGVPEESRAARTWSASQREGIGTVRGKLQQLNAVAQGRGQTLPQMAIAWTLRFPDVTTALVGASDIDQLETRRRSEPPLQPRKSGASTRSYTVAQRRKRDCR
jgi:L-glyceraldehyde 3-phosphate reductase